MENSAGAVRVLKSFVPTEQQRRRYEAAEKRLKGEPMSINVYHANMLVLDKQVISGEPVDRKQLPYTHKNDNQYNYQAIKTDEDKPTLIPEGERFIKQGNHIIWKQLTGENAGPQVEQIRVTGIVRSPKNVINR